MASAARDYVCDNGHEFGVTNWGTTPLRCPVGSCRAGFKPKRATRKPAAPTQPTLASGSYLPTSDGRMIKC